ncbi:MAG TPA: CpaF family protein [Bacillales bacterium]|nr:CpaF family protein [Bacillales bacterium]
MQIRRNKVNLEEAAYQNQVKQLEEHTAEAKVEEGNETAYSKAKGIIRERFLTNHSRLFQESMFEREKQQEFLRICRTIIKEESLAVPGMKPDDIAINVWKDLCSLGPLDKVFHEGTANEIMINGFDQPWIYKSGKHVPASDQISFESAKHLETTVVTKILNQCGKSINRTNQIVDARIGNARVSIVGNPTSVMKGPIVTIRQFPVQNFSEEDFLNYGSATPEMIEFMKLLARSGATIVMAGPTGSGKTTTYKFMAGYIPKGERTVAIENPTEMYLHELYSYEEGYHFLTEECQDTGNPETEVTIQDLIVKAGMRQFPDRFIIGEIRQARDLLAAIEASFTGHGTWWTMHGTNARAVFGRARMMVTRADPSMTVQDAVTLITESVNIIMVQKRFKKENKIRITEIVEIVGTDEKGAPIFNTIFRYNQRMRMFQRLNKISQRLQDTFEYSEIDELDYSRFITLKEVNAG